MSFTANVKHCPTTSSACRVYVAPRQRVRLPIVAARAQERDGAFLRQSVGAGLGDDSVFAWEIPGFKATRSRPHFASGGHVPSGVRCCICIYPHAQCSATPACPDCVHSCHPRPLACPLACLPAVQELLHLISTSAHPGDPEALAESLCEDDVGYKALIRVLARELRVRAARWVLHAYLLGQREQPTQGCACGMLQLQAGLGWQLW